MPPAEGRPLCALGCAGQGTYGRCRAASGSQNRGLGISRKDRSRGGQAAARTQQPKPHKRIVTNRAAGGGRRASDRDMMDGATQIISTCAGASAHCLLLALPHVARQLYTRTELRQRTSSKLSGPAPCVRFSASLPRDARPKAHAAEPPWLTPCNRGMRAAVGIRVLYKC